MSELIKPEFVIWAVGSALTVVLVAFALRHRHFTALPFFTGYLVLCLAQEALLLTVQHNQGFSSHLYLWSYWISQGLVIVARFLAATELCRRILSEYSGIWGLIWRFLAACTAAVCVFAAFSVSQDWTMAILRTERGMELGIAVFVVLFFFLARYYRVPVEPRDQLILAGFCLLSLSVVLDNSILEAFPETFIVIWRIFASVASLGALVLWAWALRRELSPVHRPSEMLERDVYSRLSPEVNLRLQLLNNHLTSLWRPKT